MARLRCVQRAGQCADDRRVLTRGPANPCLSATPSRRLFRDRGSGKADYRQTAGVGAALCVLVPTKGGAVQG